MGQQLIGRPLSQQTSFGTLNGSSSATNPISQMLAPTISPANPTPPLPGGPQSNLRMGGQFGYGMPSTLGGFRGFGGMPRYFGGLPGKQMTS